ncbi:MAG: AraC family transcriptional regulator [Pseudomonadota bacterium]
MQEFFRKALIALILLLIAFALAAWFCIDQSYLFAALIPQARGDLRWRAVTTADAVLGGTSIIHILDPGRQSLRFDFRITRATAHPYVAAEMLFEDGQGNIVPADLSRYTTVTFVAQCAPANSLVFAMPTFDASVARPGEFWAYPSPAAHFSCSERGTPVSLDLTRLAIPAWWFDVYKVDPSRQSYRLDQVAKFVFGINHHSSREVDSSVAISEFTLHGRDDRYLGALAAILAIGSGAFAIWFLRGHSRALAASLDAQLNNDLPFVAYRELTLEPFKDKEKAAILQFIGNNYADPELNMSSVATRIGADREKINEILKMELGMTFTGYVNKLRLTEAARVLKENEGKPIADIAYSVGYGNVSYFNKLFKEEYDCTPGAFRRLASQAKAPPEHDPAQPSYPAYDDA